MKTESYTMTIKRTGETETVNVNVYPCGSGMVTNGTHKGETLTPYQRNNGGCDLITLEKLADIPSATKENLESVAASNFEGATELMETYETVEACFISWEQNIVDTIKETLTGWVADDLKYALDHYAKTWIESELPIIDHIVDCYDRVLTSSKLANKTTNEVGAILFDQLGGKYCDAWNNGLLENGSYINLAKKYDLDTALEELMDDVDAMLDA